MTATIDRPTLTRPVGEERSTIGWRIGAISLVLGAGGNTAQAVLGQLYGGRPDTFDEQVVFANAHPTLVTTTFIVGCLAVPFMAIGFLAAAQELRRRARRTANVAATFLVVGMFGFLAIHVAALIEITAMLDDQGREAAAYLNSAPEVPLLAIMFGAPFMVGAVVGMLTLSIGLLVKGGVPRWIPAAWLVFIVLDFTIGGVGPVDPHWLYFAGAVGLAAHLVRGRGNARAVS